MNVKKLKEIIDKLPDDMEVLIHVKSDWYAPLSSSNHNMVEHNGDLFDVNLPAEDTCFDEDKWSKVKSMPRALVLEWGE